MLPLPPNSRSSRHFGRPGLTVPELLVTLAIAGIVTSLALPPMIRMRTAFDVRAARQQINAAYDAARSAAVQRGRPARLVVRGNAVLAIADTAAPGQPTSGTYTVLAPQDFKTAYGVQLTLRTPLDSLVSFDARGFANPRLGRTARIVITKQNASDSVCISNLGQLLRNGCLP